MRRDPPSPGTGGVSALLPSSPGTLFPAARQIVARLSGKACIREEAGSFAGRLHAPPRFNLISQ